MSFLPGLKTVWNALKVVLIALVVIAILMVAWEAVMIAFTGASVPLAFLTVETQGIILGVAGWAADNALAFTLISVVTIQMVAPNVISAFTTAAKEVITEVIDIVGSVVSTVADGLGLKTLFYGALALGGIYLLAGTSRRSDGART